MTARSSHKKTLNDFELESDKAILDWTQTCGLKEQIQDIVAMARGPFAHPVILLTGYEGVGKRHVATAVAAAFFCETGQACGVCESCKEVQHGHQRDIMTIHGRDHTSLKTAELHEIQEFLSVLSTSGQRIAIISDCERMTKEASNRMLKTLEEPPSGVRIIMTTSRPLNLLPTVLGRCLKISVKPPCEADVKTWMQSRGFDVGAVTHQDTNQEAFKWLMRKTGGAIGAIARDIERVEALDQSKELLRRLLFGGSPKQVLDAASEIAKDKALTLADSLAMVEWILNQNSMQNSIQNGLQKHDAVVAVRRRHLLSQGRRMAVQGKIALNQQLLLESIGLVPFVKDEYFWGAV